MVSYSINSLKIFKLDLALTKTSICVFYFSIRKGAPQSTHVSKYGVRARRGDVEMLPLPLDEDTEDDTVFDIGNHPNS